MQKFVHEVLVNRLAKLAEEKSVVRPTYHLDMSIAVDWDIKPLTKQTKSPRLPLYFLAHQIEFFTVLPISENSI